MALRRVRKRTRAGRREFTWLGARSFTQHWYPQGIDVRDSDDVVAVSWFRQNPKTRKHLASRLTVVRMRDGRRSDAVFAYRDENGILQPAPLHTGGIAWFGSRLLVADAHRGLWEFSTHSPALVEGEQARRLLGGRGIGRHGRKVFVLERVASYPLPVRCSFVGRILDENGITQPRILVGEYSDATSGRIVEVALPEGFSDAASDSSHAPWAIIRTHVPGIERMQGAVRWGDTTYVSQSHDLSTRSTLWCGHITSLTPHNHALPPGAEDLAISARDRQLWALGEHPFRRVVQSTPLPHA